MILMINGSGFQRALCQELTHKDPKWFEYQKSKLDFVL